MSAPAQQQQLITQNQSAGGAFDCVSRTPLGRDKVDAELKSMPPVGITIGDVGFGQVKYTPGKPFHVKISYSGSEVISFFIKAETLFGSTPVGTWVVESGEATSATCSNPNDSLIGSSLSKMGVVNAYWTAPNDQSGYVEFQLTVVGKNNKFWLWNSFLCDSQ
jgi:hypothetical protein